MGLSNLALLGFFFALVGFCSSFIRKPSVTGVGKGAAKLRHVPVSTPPGRSPPTPHLCATAGFVRGTPEELAVGQAYQSGVAAATALARATIEKTEQAAGRSQANANVLSRQLGQAQAQSEKYRQEREQEEKRRIAEQDALSTRIANLELKLRKTAEDAAKDRTDTVRILDSVQKGLANLGPEALGGDLTHLRRSISQFQKLQQKQQHQGIQGVEEEARRQVARGRNVLKLQEDLAVTHEKEQHLKGVVTSLGDKLASATTKLEEVRGAIRRERTSREKAETALAEMSALRQREGDAVAKMLKELQDNFFKQRTVLEGTIDKLQTELDMGRELEQEALDSKARELPGLAKKVTSLSTLLAEEKRRNQETVSTLSMQLASLQDKLNAQEESAAVDRKVSEAKLLARGKEIEELQVRVEEAKTEREEGSQSADMESLLASTIQSAWSLGDVGESNLGREERRSRHNVDSSLQGIMPAPSDPPPQNSARARLAQARSNEDSSPAGGNRDLRGSFADAISGLINPSTLPVPRINPDLMSDEEKDEGSARGVQQGRRASAVYREQQAELLAATQAEAKKKKGLVMESTEHLSRQSVLLEPCGRIMMRGMVTVGSDIRYTLDLLSRNTTDRLVAFKAAAGEGTYDIKAGGNSLAKLVDERQGRYRLYLVGPEGSLSGELLAAQITAGSGAKGSEGPRGIKAFVPVAPRAEGQTAVWYETTPGSDSGLWGEAEAACLMAKAPSRDERNSTTSFTLEVPPAWGQEGVSEPHPSTLQMVKEGDPLPALQLMKGEKGWQFIARGSFSVLQAFALAVASLESSLPGVSVCIASPVEAPAPVPELQLPKPDLEAAGEASVAKGATGRSSDKSSTPIGAIKRALSSARKSPRSDQVLPGNASGDWQEAAKLEETPSRKVNPPPSLIIPKREPNSPPKEKTPVKAHAPARRASIQVVKEATREMATTVYKNPHVVRMCLLLVLLSFLLDLYPAVPQYNTAFAAASLWASTHVDNNKALAKRSFYYIFSVVALMTVFFDLNFMTSPEQAFNIMELKNPLGLAGADAAEKNERMFAMATTLMCIQLLVKVLAWQSLLATSPQGRKALTLVWRRLKLFLPMWGEPRRLTKDVYNRIVALFWLHIIAAGFLVGIAGITGFGFDWAPQFASGQGAGASLSVLCLLKFFSLCFVCMALFRNMDVALTLNVFGCLVCAQKWHSTREIRRKKKHGVAYPKVLLEWDYILWCSYLKLFDLCIGLWVWVALGWSWDPVREFSERWNVQVLLTVVTCIMFVTDIWSVFLGIAVCMQISQYLLRKGKRRERGEEGEYDGDVEIAEDGTRKGGSKNRDTDDSESQSEENTDSDVDSDAENIWKEGKDDVTAPMPHSTHPYFGKQPLGHVDISARSDASGDSYAAEALPLVKGFTIRPDTFRAQWDTLPMAGSFRCRVQALPSIMDVTSHLQRRNIFVVASGVVNTQIKFYACAKCLHSPGDEGVLFMLEMVLERDMYELTVSFRSHSKELTPRFVKHLRLKDCMGDYQAISS